MMVLMTPVNGQITCAGIANVDSLATPIWTGECMCNAGYIWNPTTSVCNLCSGIAGTTTGSVQGSCACVAPSIWRGSTRTCILPTTIDCSASPNWKETTPVQTPKACLCINGYTWSSFFLRCQYTCASTLRFYNVGARPTAQNSCPCIAKTVWAGTQCRVNCGSITYALNPAVNSTTCNCRTNFIWRSNNLTCVVNCPILWFATATVSDTQCTCNTALSTWSTTSFQCNANCNNNNLFPFSSGLNTTSGGCLCQTGYLWSATLLQCSLNCGNVTNSTGVAATTTSCVCISDNYWFNNSCIANCSTMPNGIYSGAYKTCVPNCAVIPQATAGSLFKNPNGWYECACPTGIAWNNATMTCGCDSRSTFDAGSGSCVCKTGSPTPPNQFNQIKDATTQKCVCSSSTLTDSTTQTSPSYNSEQSYC